MTFAQKWSRLTFAKAAVFGRGGSRTSRRRSTNPLNGGADTIYLKKISGKKPHEIKELKERHCLVQFKMIVNLRVVFLIFQN